jgi:glycerol-3-phosphate O-acyltransferase
LQTIWVFDSVCFFQQTGTSQKQQPVQKPRLTIKSCGSDEHYMTRIAKNITGKGKAKFNGLLSKLLQDSHNHFLCQLPDKIGLLTTTLLKMLWSGIRINETQSDTLRQLHEKGIVVFANKYVSHFEFLFYYTRYKQLKLPYPQIGFYYRFLFWQPLSRILRVTISRVDYFLRHFSRPDPFKSGHIREELANGRSGLISLIDSKGFNRRFVKAKTDPIQYLIEAQREIDRPIFIVPQLMFFSNKPQRSETTLIDILFGSEENPGRLRRLLTLIRNPKKVFVEIPDPINLDEFLSWPEIQKMNIVQQAATLRRHLISVINRHRQSIIGPVLKSRVELKESILTDQRVQRFVTAHAESEELPIQQVQKKAGDYIEEIAANYSQNWIKMYDITLRIILKMMFEGMIIDEEGLSRIKRMATKGPLVLVPCHKSHLDYLILSWLFYHNNMPCPHIAAGKNLSFWPFGTIFRGGGAFFLRRTFRGKPLYSKIFSEYIRKILQEGFNIEFFIEGTRSRTGKLLTPKLGLLSIIIDAFMNGACEDVIFVPIYIGYDRVLEEKAYLHEMEGGKKEPENLKQVIKARKFLKKRYGKVYVNFHEPLSLQDFLRHNNLKKGMLEASEQQELCRNLGARFINAINQESVVTPYGIVAAAILNCRRKRVALDVLYSYLETYMTHLVATNTRLSDTLQLERHRAFDQVLDTFANRKFIDRNTSKKETEMSASRTLIKINESRRPGLDYYKNSVVIFFIPAAFTALAILETDAFLFTAGDLHPTYRFLQNFFTNEFSYDIDKKPTTSYEKR